MYKAQWPAPNGHLASIEVLQALRAVGGKNSRLIFDRTGSPDFETELVNFFLAPPGDSRVIQTGDKTGDGKLKSKYAYAVVHSQQG